MIFLRIIFASALCFIILPVIAAPLGLAPNFDRSEILKIPVPATGSAPVTTGEPNVELRSGIVYTTLDFLGQTEREFYKKQSEIIARQGYLRIEDDGQEAVVGQILKDHLKVKRKNQLIPLERAVPQLTFTPATFSKTSLADAVLIGSTLHGAREARNGGKFDALSRIYKTKEFGNVRLVENDYVAGGGAALFYTEDLNTDVNGVPAEFSVLCKRADRCETTLRWATQKIEYTLTSDKGVFGAERIAAFKAIAIGMH